MRRHSDFFRRPTQRRTNERPNTILHRKEFNVRGRTIKREKPREKQLSSEQASGHTSDLFRRSTGTEENFFSQENHL